jgi:integral membrane sensor domain MASE1
MGHAWMELSMPVLPDVSLPLRPLTWSGFRVGLVTSLVLALGFGAMIAITFAMQNEMIARDRDNQMAGVSQAITAALDQARRFALAQAETTARRPSVARATGPN